MKQFTNEFIGAAGTLAGAGVASYWLLEHPWTGFLSSARITLSWILVAIAFITFGIRIAVAILVLKREKREHQQ